jgi:hypothetical protein
MVSLVDVGIWNVLGCTPTAIRSTSSSRTPRVSWTGPGRPGVARIDPACPALRLMAAGSGSRRRPRSPDVICLLRPAPPLRRFGCEQTSVTTTPTWTGCRSPACRRRSHVAQRHLVKGGLPAPMPSAVRGRHSYTTRIQAAAESPEDSERFTVTLDRSHPWQGHLAQRSWTCVLFG